MCLRLVVLLPPRFPAFEAKNRSLVAGETAAKKRTGGCYIGGTFFSNEKVPPFPNNSLSLFY